MAAASRALLPGLFAAAALATVPACHSSGCREGDFACAALADTATTGDPGTTTTEATTTSTPPLTTSSEPTVTTEVPPVCGDGVVAGDEQCDDGNDDELDACKSDCTPTTCGDGVLQAGEACDDGNDDDTDACVGACQHARCGDGFVRAELEQCDAGPANDDEAYEGCTTACEPGPRCGDAIINGEEDCDDNNTDETDGCMSSCVEARSCLQVKTLVPRASTGKYRLWPEALGGETSVEAWCDMDSDGGGYTFLKVDSEFGLESDKGAKKAEEVCKKYGMHLLVTRTPAHVKSSYEVATTSNIAPVGGGSVAANVDYLAILAIYPTAVGATCEMKALNSNDCPGWRAGDDQPYWVRDTPYADQPDEDHCAGCSMIYKWNPDGTAKSYATVSFGEGASSYRFLCDVGDKHP
ncbi:DUF4215 domain-containing protein [Nannocystis bainbridge]|uniref:DUF4215 domain-containing protein n=1 Tax=Nannocystis bainbridge TaxID=2995303 RepID=A0ABT5DRP9_9BACT|nr:DUF4215 domain-containing protein [Nannocystis bainbridge]MDC0716288.1 DUF4215 domain-containing protein [Nannocystis bainbridge]